MIKFYINKNQLYNFFVLKEPVEFINTTFDEDYFEVSYNVKDIEINTYRTHSTVELKSFRKKVKKLCQKLRIRKKH